MAYSWCYRSLFRPLSLFLLLAGTVVGQSLDDVKIVPRIENPKVPAAEDALEAHVKPLRVDVDLVLVPVTVTDAQGNPAMDLARSDFKLFEGEEEQKVQYFYAEDAPVSVGLIVDLSSSMANKLDRVRQAVAEFFQNADPDDDYFVITFSDKPELLADTTQSVETIEAELGNVNPAGGTPLLDAIYLGLDKLKHARYQRRALLIISDGGDNTSRYRAKEIREIAQESDAQIYAMGIFSPLTIAIEDRRGKKLLSEITDATGGRSVFLSSPDRLPKVSADFSRELRSQYVLGYRPKDLLRDGRPHKITVKLNAGMTHSMRVYYKRQYIAFR